MANQLFKSGTSIGANVKEAQGAENKADFKHKCKIAYKEAEETEYWLDLCKFSNNYPVNLVLTDDFTSYKKGFRQDHYIITVAMNLTYIKHYSFSKQRTAFAYLLIYSSAHLHI